MPGSLPRRHRAVAAVLAAAWLLGACVPVPAPTAAPAHATLRDSDAPPAQPSDTSVAAVIGRMEPVAEALCRNQTRGVNCDFAFAVDDRPDQPPNAFQTLDRSGRPYVVLTTSLIAMMRNPDELAFVLGHEAAHHIAGHIPRRQDQAMSGAVLAGVIAAASGATPDEIRTAQSIGADLAARQYSREFELEADVLGAEIAWVAGFDPVLGAAFFARLPDPGDKFLGTHPPNRDRKAAVAAAVRRLEGG